MQDPREPHWVAVKCILHYLKFSSDHTFFISKSSSRHLVAFSDSDWAGCPAALRLVIAPSLAAIYSHGAPKSNLLSQNPVLNLNTKL